MTEKAQSLFSTFAKGSVVITTSTAITQVVALLATILILRYVSVYDYGLWRLILSVLGIFQLITVPGLDAVLTADSAREFGAGNKGLYVRILRKTSLSYVLFGVVAAAILLVAAPVISSVTKIGLTFYLSIIAITLVSSSITRAYTIAFSTQLQFARVQAMTFINSLVYLVSLGVFVYFHSIGIAAIVISYAIATGVPALLFLPLFLNLFKGVRQSGSYSLTATIRAHGKWSILLDYANEGSNFLKPWIIGYFVGIEAVGIFSAATSMLSVVANIVPINQILASVLPRESHDRDRTGFIFTRTLKYWMWLYALLALGTLVAAPLLIPIIFPKYQAALPFLLIMLLSLFATAINNATAQALNTFRRQRDLLVSTVAPRIVSVCAVLPLALTWLGLYGAVLDQIFTSYASAFMRNRYIKDLQELSIRWRSFFEFDDFDRQTVQRIWSGIKMRVPFI